MSDENRRDTGDELSEFLVGAFNDSLMVEENCLGGKEHDLSIREIHVIEAVAAAEGLGEPGRAAEIAALLRVTPGTLTASVATLEKKGFLVRLRDENDRRGVRIATTGQGREINRIHAEFHREMADGVTNALTGEEAGVLITALDKVRGFFAEKERMCSGKVKIYADSTCDLTPEEAADLGVALIPMSVVFGDEVCQQGVNLTTPEFYEKQTESKVNPTTVQLTPYDLEQVYRDATDDGSEVVAIHLSSALSGTYQSAVLASRAVKGVYAIDSKNATFGSNLLVRIAVKMRDEGKPASEIATKITELTEKVRLVAYVSTLKYLVRGGRLSAVAGVAGSVLGISPIIRVVDGALVNAAKPRGKKAAFEELVRQFNMNNIDKDYEVVFGHSRAAESLAEFKGIMAPFIDGCRSSDCEIGPVIGTHTGPGAVGVVFISKD